MKISGVMLFPLFLMLSGANSQLPSGSGPYRTAGISLSSATTQGQVVVILVPDLTEVVAEIADAVAKARGGAMAVPVESVFASTTDMSDQLIDYLVTKGGMEDAAMYPVIGLGGAAEHAIRLAYEDWPVAVAVTPDLSVQYPSKTVTRAESDAGPHLLLIADVDTNGPFVTDAEQAMDLAGIHWETVRYGGVGPDFWDSSAPGFSAEVTSRAWPIMLSFLEDAANGGTAGTKNPGTEIPAGVASLAPFKYMDGSDGLEGYLAYPAGGAADGNKHPAVVILPDWDGQNQYEISRANMLAEMGYVALAANIFGDPMNTTTPDAQTRIARITAWRSDSPAYVQRIRAAAEALMAQDYVDGSSIGVMGYCFGGTGVIYEAMAPGSSLKVDVSFHGGLSVLPSEITASNIVPYLSAQSGGSDESPDEIMWLQDTMSGIGGTKWDITRYSKVGHGFTVWGGGAYHLRADGRSWDAMKALFLEFIPPAVGPYAQARHYATGTALSDASKAGDVVIILVEKITDEAKGVAAAIAEAAGGALMAAVQSVFSSTTDMSAQLVDYVTSMGGSNDPAMYPVVGLQAAAEHALRLAYEDWPVTVSVTPDLSKAYPSKNVTRTESDPGPQLLLIADVKRNGPYVTDMEQAMDLAGIHWETVRYGVGPEFWDEASPGYEAAVTMRAWNLLTSFLRDAKAGGTRGTENPGMNLPAGVSSIAPFMYMDGGNQLEGYLAFPTGGDRSGDKHPAVIVLPDASGQDQYEIARANLLAEMGYVALAANVYGDAMNTTLTDRAIRSERLNYWRGESEVYVQRIRAAAEALKAQDFVNGSAVGVMGYCFGGTGTIFEAITPGSTLQVAVSFHGGLSGKPTTVVDGTISPYLSVQSGGADESPEDIMWLQETLSAVGGAKWDITRYSKVEHSFTSWNASGRYHPRADGRSWDAMTALFREHMPPVLASQGDATDADSAASFKSSEWLAAFSAILALVMM